MTGRVQGVGFRWFAREEAQALGVSGWARNREDGTVELEAEGEPGALEAFIARLKDGNPAARVDGVARRELPPAGEKGFRIVR